MATEADVVWMTKFIQQEINRVIDMANGVGLVIRVDLVTTQPLRMGGYTMVPDIRQARVMAEPFTEYERLENQHLGNPEIKTGIYSGGKS